MSIASEISRLQTAKADLKTSIENKGVTVPSATTLDGYAALVDQISGGGITTTEVANATGTTLEITSSGGGSPNIQSLSVTANGTYNAPNGVDGYSPVVVSVPSGGGESCTLSISDDGIVASNFSSGAEPSRYSATGYDQDNLMSVTYYKDGNLSAITWIDSTSGSQFASHVENFPTIWSSDEGMASTMNYSDAFIDVTFSATVIVSPASNY